MKYIIARIKLLLITVLVMLLLGFHSSSNAEQFARLWKIEKLGLAPSYIMATMHSEDPRIVAIPEIIDRHLSNSKNFVAELDLNIDVSASLLNNMMLPAKMDLKQLLGNDLFDKSSKILRHYGMSSEIIKRFKPWAIIMIISFPKPQTGLFLDKVLFNKAKKLGKNIYGLETVKEQIDVFDNLPYAKQITLLQDLLNQYNNYDDVIEQLTLIYLKGDLEAMLRLNQQQMAKGDIQVAKELMYKLIDKRNAIMVQRMMPYLIDGRTFIAVGALHLAGSVGIIALLRQRKFTVTAVY